MRRFGVVVSLRRAIGARLLALPATVLTKQEKEDLVANMQTAYGIPPVDTRSVIDATERRVMSKIHGGA
jgi:hypothetical protein